MRRGSRSKNRVQTKPYRYQRIGVKRIVRKFKGRALLADEMGLGKTPQSLWAAKELRERALAGAKSLRKSKRLEGTVVIVCPANLKWNWQAEARKHAHITPEILEGKNPRKTPGRRGRHYVINYDIIGRPGKERKTWLNWLRRLKPQLVIIDEVQYIKNPQTIRCKGVRELCKGVPYVIGLGGTGGLENCPAELFPVLNIIRPDVFDSFYTFAMRYCAPRRTYWGWEFKGATNLEELNELLKSTCMVRRLKKDVLKDLPPKSRSVIPVEIENRAEYVEAEKDFIRWLRKKSKRKALRAASAQKLVQMGYLKRLAAQLKMKAVVAWIEEFLQQNPHEKLIVFGVHKSVLHALHDRYKKSSVLVTGDTPGRERQRCVDAFNNDVRLRIFFGNIDAAGVGWSCTAASTVLFAEMAWTPGKHVQAEDRIHGVGRGVKGKRAFVYYLVAKGTIEEMLCGVLQKKQEVIDMTLDGKPGVAQLNVMSMLEQKYMEMAA